VVESFGFTQDSLKYAKAWVLPGFTDPVLPAPLNNLVLLKIFLQNYRHTYMIPTLGSRFEKI
jgi:hypothetical protein